MKFKIYDHQLAFSAPQKIDSKYGLELVSGLNVKIGKASPIYVMDGDTINLTHTIDISVFDLIRALFIKKTINLEKK